MDVMIPRSGLVEGEKISGYLRGILSDPRIEELPVPFSAVATDLKTGKEVWIREGSLIDAIRASISLPGIFTPYGRNGQWLVDGGLVNPVPVSPCRAMGADIVIAVNLNSDIMGKPKVRRMADPPNNNGSEQERDFVLGPGSLGGVSQPDGPAGESHPLSPDLPGTA